MLFKLSVRNTRRSYKEYLIYFTTLVLSVAMFYVFTSLNQQPFMKQLNGEITTEINNVLNLMSLLATCIVSGLVVYANHYLIKRRQKEIGMYLVLGIDQIKVHLMLFIETMLVGLISLVIGIILGMFAIRVASLLVIELLGLSFTNETIFISIQGIFSTSLIFMAIFLFISMINYFNLSRLQLVDLLSGGKQSASITLSSKLKLPILKLWFILSILSGLVGYYLLIMKGIDLALKTTIFAGIAILFGHFGTFFSGSYLLSKWLAKKDNIMYKNINLFTLKQITNKINKNALMLSIISFMMGATFLTMGAGFSFKTWIDSSLKYKAPYDVSISGLETSIDLNTVVKYIEQSGYLSETTFEFNVYYSPYTLDDVTDFTILKDHAYIDKNELSNQLKMIKLSDYNRLRVINGYEELSLQEDEFMINSSDSYVLGIKNWLESNQILELNGRVLKTNVNQIMTDPVGDQKYLIGGVISLIVPDNVISGEEFFTKSIIVNTKQAIASNFDRELYEFIGNIPSGGHFVVTQTEAREFNVRQASMAIFTGMYLGVVLLIAGGTILSLQQLTESNDNKIKYQMISKLGVDDYTINRAIFKQVFFYFLVPATIALPHFLLGLVVINRWTSIGGQFSMGLAIISTLFVFGFIYLLYFGMSYSGCKKIVHGK